MIQTPVIKQSRENFFGNLEFVTNGVIPAEGLPVVIHFHGMGERGLGTTSAELIKMLGSNMPKKVAAQTNPFPENCIVYCPQDPYFSVSTTLGIDLCLQNIAKVYSGTYRVKNADGTYRTLPKADLDRVYVMGLSAGGGAVHLAVGYFAHKIAAAISVCASGSYPERAALAVNLPIQMFHAKNDETCNYGVSQRSYDALIKAGSKVAKFTLYPTGGHGIWDTAYNTPGLLEWMFAQRTSKNVVVIPNVPPSVGITSTFANKIEVGSRVIISGTTSDNDGFVKSIDCYVNDILHSTYSQSDKSSFTFELGSSLPIGQNIVKIVATDNSNAVSAISSIVNICPAPQPILKEADLTFEIENDALPNKIQKYGNTVALYDKLDKIFIPFETEAGNFRLRICLRTGSPANPFQMANSYNLYVNGVLRSDYVLDQSSRLDVAGYGGATFAELIIEKAAFIKGINKVEIEAKGQWGGVDYVQALEVY